MTRVVVAMVIAVALFARPSPAAAAPRLERVATAGRITIHAEPGLERTATMLARSAEATLERIAVDLSGLPVPRAIEVRLVRDAADLAAVAPPGRGAPAWAIGVAYPDLGVISVATRRGAATSDPAATLRHELAHVALGAALGPRAPRWLHEGFAYQHSAEWSWERTETLAGMAWFGSVIPIGELDTAFPAAELPAHRAYAESYDFVGYLSRRGRWPDKYDDGDRWPFRRFLAELSRGQEVDAAALRAFGSPLRALFDEWRSDLDSRYMLMPIGLLGLGLWVLCALLLVLAWARRKRVNRRRVAQWEVDDATRAAAAASFAAIPVLAAVTLPGDPPPAGDPPAEDTTGAPLLN